MKILVTGANGFIGKNLISQFSTRKDFEMIPFHHEHTQADLQQAISKSDFICHLAGVNRPVDSAEFVSGNTNLTQELCQAVQKSGRRIPIIFTSSIQVERDNPYGMSKLAAEQILLQHSESSGMPVYIFRLPNVFGKWCQPNYNSVVATFCHNIARNIPIQIEDPTYQLNLVYVDDLITTFNKIITGKELKGPYCKVQPIYPICVGELAEQIQSFRESRNSLVTEQVGVGLKHALYATYVSYLPPQNFSYEIPKHGDARGVFVEILKTKDSGQFSFLTAHPGVTRGSHYHHSKTEKFLVVKGSVRFRFRHILTQETHEILTSGDKPEIVEAVPGWTHDLTNIGDNEMILVVWANEVFDCNHPDTYFCPV